MRKIINCLPGWPYCAEDEIEAVAKVLKSGKINYWTGEECKLFEKEFADYIGVPHAISVANGTVALELALNALDIGVGDDVIVPCRTFIATASCVIARGARPVCADVDLVSQNITVETITKVMTPKTKAIIVVHLAGWPCAMDSIMDFAKQHKLKVIEDCAQSIGARYQGIMTGAFGDAAAFSFCQDKIVTTGGEGGMMVTKDEEIWRKAWMYKDHGKNPDAAFVKQFSGGFRWLHESFGSNFRMTEMQAAIGRKQLAKLPEWLRLRKRNADILNAYFKDIPALRLTIPSSEIDHAYYKYYVFVKPELLKPGVDRLTILEEIHQSGIPCGTGICGEIYLEKAFASLNMGPKERFSNARELSETGLMFQVHPTLSEENMLEIAQITSIILTMR